MGVLAKSAGRERGFGLLRGVLVVFGCNDLFFVRLSYRSCRHTKQLLDFRVSSKIALILNADLNLLPSSISSRRRGGGIIGTR